MRGNYIQPKGLRYIAEFISENQEEELLHLFTSLEFEPVIIHHNPSKRTVKHYGYKYDELGELIKEDLPGKMVNLRDRCAQAAELQSNELNSCYIINYPPGSSMGWHSDARIYGPIVVGVSLNAPCIMQFQQTKRNMRNVYELELAPRSLYIMSGESRYFWQHRIAPPSEQRYSITFRVVK